MDTNDIWKSIIDLRIQVKELKNRVSIAKAVEILSDAARKIVSDHRQHMDGMFANVVDRLDGLYASVECLEEDDGKKDRKLNDLNKRLEDLEAIHDDIDEDELLTATIRDITNRLGKLEEEADEGITSVLNDPPYVFEGGVGYAPEPESRHGQTWTYNEEEFLDKQFQNFLDQMAYFTGRKEGAIFWRVRDKVIPRKDG
jgi:hypothetical protein